MMIDSARDPQPALVVIVNNRRDWQRVVEQGWYRIPADRAPYPLAARWLAFFFTRTFGADAWSVTWYAPIARYRLATRRELIPDEPDHPRADRQYFQIQIGAPARLDRPIPSRRLRRVVFIPTTLDRLHTAADVADLWQIDDEALLWREFRDAALKATRRLEIEERRAMYRSCVPPVERRRA